MQLVIAVLVFATTNGLSHDATKALGRMSRQIALKYFASAKCLAVVTEEDSSIMDYVKALDIPNFHVQLPRTVMESKRLTAGPTFLSILYKYNVS
jgi:hypothetical protein